MYKLESDGMTNEADIALAESFPDKLKKICDMGDVNKWMYAIFHEVTENDSKAQNVRIALSYADRWRIPASKAVTDILWFALMVNSNLSPSVRIRSLHQAGMLYELYEGHYKQVALDPEKDKVRWIELVCQHPDIFPGYTVKWNIPISFFVKDGKSQCTLSGLNYGEVQLFGEMRRIPRKIFIQWFRDKMVKGRIIGDDSEYVKSCFDPSNREALRSCLEYLGFHTIQELKRIDIPMGHTFVQEEKLIYVGNMTPPQDHLWESVGTSWILLPRQDYIPLIASSDYSATSLLTA